MVKRSECAELRRLMIERVEEVDPDRKAAIALSGGKDSLAMLFAMLESGRKPRCYTFCCVGHPNRDVQIAEHVTKFYGLDHVVVPLPVDHESIIEDVREVLQWQQANKPKKTIIECLRPWLYVGPAMQARGDNLIFIGFAAGNFTNLAGRDQKILRQIGEEEFVKQGWRDYYFDYTERSLQFVDSNVKWLCDKKYGIQMEDMFACDPIFDWARQHTVYETNRAEDGRRLEKAVLIYAFEDYVREVGTPGESKSYQIRSGIADFHEGLLYNEEYNPGGKHKGVIGIYNDIANGRL